MCWKKTVSLDHTVIKQFLEMSSQLHNVSTSLYNHKNTFYLLQPTTNCKFSDGTIQSLFLLEALLHFILKHKTIVL